MRVKLQIRRIQEALGLAIGICATSEDGRKTHLFVKKDSGPDFTRQFTKQCELKNLSSNGPIGTIDRIGLWNVTVIFQDDVKRRVSKRNLVFL